MIVINRKAGHALVIGNEVTVRVLKAEPDRVWIAISAPPGVGVLRHEDMEAAMIPAGETPLERVEREIAELKALPDIVVPVRRPDGLQHHGPWDGLHEHCKFLFLSYLDWAGVSADDRQRIMTREVKPYDFWDCYRRSGPAV